MEMLQNAGHDVVEGSALLEAARKAWEWYGVDCHVRPSQVPGSGIAGAVDLPERRHVEVFIQDAHDGIWSTLPEWLVTDQWMLRAVVPRRVLGAAHDALREYGCELQGYWARSDGEIEFGPVEIA